MEVASWECSLACATGLFGTMQVAQNQSNAGNKVAV